jgi:hypothetical protein
MAVEAYELASANYVHRVSDPNLAEHDAGSSLACSTVATVAAAVGGLSGRVELSSLPCFSVATAAAAVGG